MRITKAQDGWFAESDRGSFNRDSKISHGWNTDQTRILEGSVQIRVSSVFHPWLLYFTYFFIRVIGVIRGPVLRSPVWKCARPGNKATDSNAIWARLLDADVPADAV